MFGLRQLCDVTGGIPQGEELSAIRSGIGSSNEADQGNKIYSAMILGVPRQQSLFLVACHFVPVLYFREMISDREIEILFKRLRLYDQLVRRAEGLVRTIQRVMRERYGDRARPFRNRAHARPGPKTA
jgi:hypothetical protein